MIDENDQAIMVSKNQAMMRMGAAKRTSKDSITE
jgi:hypothetical protein